MANLPDVEDREVAKPKEESFWENVKAGKCVTIPQLLTKDFNKRLYIRPLVCIFAFKLSFDVHQKVNGYNPCDLTDENSPLQVLAS